MNELKEKLRNTGLHILAISRNELYISMRFLDIALAQLKPEMNLSTKTIGTDGVSILFNPRFLMETYSDDRVFVNRVYMHMLVHNLFGHEFHGKNKNEAYWNLACDIAAESLVDSMDAQAVKVVVSDYREYIYARLKKQMHVLTAEAIYHYLRDTFISDREFSRLQQAFTIDDHRFWNSEDSDQEQEVSQQHMDTWQKISEKMQTNMQTLSKDYGEAAGALLEYLKIEHREHYDYREFLQRFAAWGEEIKIDDDSFDYAFYTYGMDHYGNMPLIEPLEYKAVKKIDEFVIAIDTSQSCPPEIIKKFLGQTYEILSERESFFKQINVHILQCDAGIQLDIVITKSEDFKAYMENFQVSGFGGTDFNPVFDYTRKLIEEGTFRNLRGLIYFTDGYGAFPKQKPDFETAFVFMTEQYCDRDVPPWAMKLILEPEDFQKDLTTNL